MIMTPIFNVKITNISTTGSTTLPLLGLSVRVEFNLKLSSSCVQSFESSELGTNKSRKCKSTLKPQLEVLLMSKTEFSHFCQKENKNKGTSARTRKPQLVHF